MAANRSSKPPVTVKLTDSDVIAIVAALGRFRAKDIAPTGTVREIGALEQPALASIVARHAEIELAQLAALRAEYAARWPSEPANKRASAALSVAWKFMHHGASWQASGDGALLFECNGCGSTGRAHSELTGAIFTSKCGEVTP